MYFLEHGYFSPEGNIPVIDVEEMPEEKALELCVFLEENNEHRESWDDALKTLQHRFRRAEDER